MKYICVFCGTSDAGAEKYTEVAQALGRLIVENGYGLVCGGANAGLMNTIINAVLAANGKVIGVITPEILKIGVVHSQMDQIIEAETYAERKQTMMEFSEGFIALPGGLGTLDEVMEVTIANQFANFGGKRVKPLALLNVDNFFEGTLKQLDRSCEEKFMTQKHREMIYAHHDPAFIIQHIVKYKTPPTNKDCWWEKPTSPLNELGILKPVTMTEKNSEINISASDSSAVLGLQHS